MRDRSALGYAEPHPDIPDFAQCGTCQLWLERQRRCLWLAPNKEVTAGASCVMYVQGPPISDDEEAHPLSVFTPSEVGFVEELVRCENCSSIDKAGTHCDLYREMSRTMPRLWSLDPKIKKRACCNAFEK